MSLLFYLTYTEKNIKKTTSLTCVWLWFDFLHVCLKLSMECIIFIVYPRYNLNICLVQMISLFPISKCEVWPGPSSYFVFSVWCTFLYFNYSQFIQIFNIWNTISMTSFMSHQQYFKLMFCYNENIRKDKQILNKLVNNDGFDNNVIKVQG